MDYHAYLADQANCNNALKATIVSAVQYGISADYIQNMQVTAAATSNLRAGAKRLTATLGLSYTVQIPDDWGVSYTQLSSNLVSSVSSGAFTSSLQQNAQIYAAPELNTASSTTVSTTDYSTTSNSSSSKSAFSAGVIVGIVIGCFAALVLCCFALQSSVSAADMRTTLHSHLCKNHQAKVSMNSD